MYTSFTVLRGHYDKTENKEYGGLFVFFGIVEMIQLVFQVAFLEYFRELVSIGEVHSVLRLEWEHSNNLCCPYSSVLNRKTGPNRTHASGL